MRWIAKLKPAKFVAIPRNIKIKNIISIAWSTGSVFKEYD